MIDQLLGLPASTWVRTVVFAGLAAVAVGVPADLIDTPLINRPIDTRPVDYVIWITTSLLIGLIFAIRVPKGSGEVEENRTLWGAVVSVLAVGCPICNPAVVAIVGTSGAISWWAPVQPIVGLVAIGLLIWALRKRLETYELGACPLPKKTTSAA